MTETTTQTDIDNKIDHLLSLICAAKHLILAAKGPEDGPTQWDVTRNRWMDFADEALRKADR